MLSNRVVTAHPIVTQLRLGRNHPPRFSWSFQSTFSSSFSSPLRCFDLGALPSCQRHLILVSETSQHPARAPFYRRRRRQAAHLTSAQRSLSTAEPRATCHVLSALSSGPLPYEVGWAHQHVLLHRRLRSLRQSPEALAAAAHDDDRDWLLLFEHQPVYTLGRGASERHLPFLSRRPDGGADALRRLDRRYRGPDASRLDVDLARRHVSSSLTPAHDDAHAAHVRALLSGTPASPVRTPSAAPVYRVERGGEVTYHGPGQLVVYPLLRLTRSPPYRRDLHWYLRRVEEVVVRTLGEFGVASRKDDEHTGVWVGDEKIAAVGVSSSRWITTHGFAINVDLDLEGFDRDVIVPCGIEDRGVTSLRRVLVEEGTKKERRGCGDGAVACPTVEEVGEVVVRCFGEVFGVDMVREEEILL
ncbi:hypothetical protein ACHAXS_003522 [Conticribra weissflogii]